MLTKPGIYSIILFIKYFERNINLFINKLIKRWANLELKTYNPFPDDIQSYMSGFLEGYITGDLIEMNYENNIQGYCDGQKVFCHLLKEFVKNNTQFVENMIEKNKNNDYWHQIYLINKQINGLEAGYRLWKVKNNRSLAKEKYLSEILFLNLGSELSTLGEILSPGSGGSGGDHCSAIIKPLADGSDLFIAHNTWNTYDSMIRFMKRYSFAFNSLQSNGKPIAGHSVAFSSYPGLISSADDYYILSSGLVVQETTNENHNQSLFLNITADNIVFEFVRNVLANRLANSGKEWTQLFGEYNSGTYNNQFMVLDYKLFKKGTKLSQLPDHLLWIIEQMPNYIRAEDVTHVLRAQGYWASYNIPYFKDEYKITGYEELFQKYGPFYSYNLTSRAHIFRRDHSKVTDLKTLYSLMRYNDFKNDPFSQCKQYNQTCSPPYSADLAIASRNDLNDPKGHYPFKEWTHRGEGAIDAKMTNSSMVWNLEMLAVSGPTDRQQPPFQWSKTHVKLSHVGQPDVFNFKPIYVKWFPNTYQIANDV